MWTIFANIPVGDDAAEIEEEAEPLAFLSAALQLPGALTSQPGMDMPGNGAGAGATRQCANVKLGDIKKCRKTLQI